MSNSNDGCLSVLLVAGALFSWIVSGTLAWDWVEPDDFGGAIGFLIVWAILGRMFQFATGLLAVLLANLLGK